MESEAQGHPAAKGSRTWLYPAIWAMVGAFLLLYIVFPAVLVYPLYLACAKRPPPKPVAAVMMVGLYPHIAVARKYDWYGRWLMSQADFLGMK